MKNPFKKGLLALLALGAMGLAACGGSTTETSTQTSQGVSSSKSSGGAVTNTSDVDKDGKIYEIYLLYQKHAIEAGNTPLTYEEWLESIRGEDGVDGLTPYIGENGNWWIGDTDTGVKAVGQDGKDGKDGRDGSDGRDGIDGQDGRDGSDGRDGIDGRDGSNGRDGSDGRDGIDGQDGQDGEDGETPYIGENGNWWIGDTDTGVKAQAQDGLTPYIGENGNWWIGDTDTGVKAEVTVHIEGDGHVHTYGEWIEGEPATCTSMGYDYRVCELCDAKDYRFHEAKGHVLEDEPYYTMPATASSDGFALYSCTVCGETVTRRLAIVRTLEFELNEEGTAYSVVGIGNCLDLDIVIPEMYEGLPVVGIGASAFEDCDNVISITVPDTVEFIGNRAFAACDNLLTVTLPCDTALGVDVFRDSMSVEVIYHHHLHFVEEVEATCTEPGNIAHYVCESCGNYYEDEDGTVRLYNVTVQGHHEYEDGICTVCGARAEEVTIVAVDEVGNLGNFPLGTMEDNIGLPTLIGASTADNVRHEFPVVWDLGDYDRTVAGTYEFTGHIQATGFFFESEELAQVYASITLTETLVGTADIVFVLDISGSMSSYINNVKNNLVSLATDIEAAGVSARWGLVTYSDYTCMSDSGTTYPEREPAQLIRNGAADWFTSASTAATAINGIELAYGGDGPEAAVDGLMFAHENLSVRRDARVFYILLTDAETKVDNHYGLTSMSQLTDIFVRDGICVSTIANSSYYSYYNDLVNRTGGIITSIGSSSFVTQLKNHLIPIIFSSVSGGGEMPVPDEPYTINLGDSYPWYESSTGTYRSSNNGVHSSTSSMYISFAQSGTFTFEYRSYAESGCDYLIVSKNGSSLFTTSSSNSSSYYTRSISVTAGDTLQFAFRKDGSVNNYDDCAYIRNFSFSA